MSEQRPLEYVFRCQYCGEGVALEKDIDDFDWDDFPEDEQPRVFTAVSSVCRDGKNDDCPGHGENEGHAIFWVRPCDKLPARHHHPQPGSTELFCAVVPESIP